MYPGDSESDWPAKLLTGSRVEHYWDEQRVIGRWYGENVTAKKKGHVEWDAYFLYRASSKWGDAGPSDLVSWGRTIVNTREQLKKDLGDLLAAEE